MSKTVHVCTARILPKDLYENLRVARIHPGGPFRAVTPLGKLWMNGSTLQVSFFGGTATQRAKAMEQAIWWTKYANLKFRFTDSPQADIRVAFDKRDGAWSYLGTDARQIPFGQPTMNLGFLDGGTAAHEFGHAIGLAHEHQNPAGGIQWNEKAVISAMAGPPNFWTAEQTRHNILNRYQFDQINGTEFDPDSIMLYFFPASWTKNGIGTNANERLSELDKAFVASAMMYPKCESGVEDRTRKLTVGANRWKKASIRKPCEEDIFSVSVRSGGRYIFETKGKADVVMKVFGPNSPTNVIAEDDDSGTDQNARIIVDLVPAQYFVQIRHWNDRRVKGTYSVRVTREPR